MKRKRTKKSSFSQQTRDVMNHFAGVTTCHGISWVIQAESILSRVAWVAITLTSFGAFIIGAGYLVDKYLQYPSTTNMNVLTENMLPFPQVTVCNLNMLRRSQLRGTIYEGLLDVDDENTQESWSDYDFWFDQIEVLPSDKDETSSSHSFSNYYFDFPSNVPAPPPDLDSVEAHYSEDGIDKWNEFRDTNYESFILRYDPEKEYKVQNWTKVIDTMSEDKMETWAELIHPSLTEMARMGHQGEDFILQCSFNGRPCSYRDFHRSYVAGLGNCYTFNHAVNVSSKVRKTSKVGTKSGLRLTLFLEQPEYVGFISPETGVKISVDPPCIQSFPNVDGIVASPGFSTLIGLRQTSTIRLPKPYGYCIESNDKVNELGYNYTYSACIHSCLDKFIFHDCECHHDERFGSPECDIRNKKQRYCVAFYQRFYFNIHKARCRCKEPCHEITYRKTISTAVFPSRRFEHHLYHMLRTRNERLGKILENPDQARQNFVRLKIYFEELNHEIIQQMPLVTMENLLSSIGGMMGLFIGLSVITLFEFLHLLKSLFGIFIKSRKKARSRRNGAESCC